MSHHQNLQHSGFVPYPSHHPVYPDSIDSDSHDSLSTKVGPFGDENTATDEHFFVGDPDLEQLDPWRGNVPSPMPRIADAITQGMFYWSSSPTTVFCLLHCFVSYQICICSINSLCTPASQTQWVAASSPAEYRASRARSRRHFAGTKRRPADAVFRQVTASLQQQDCILCSSALLRA